MVPEVLRSLQVSSALCARLLREPLTAETLDSLKAAEGLLLEEPFCSLAPVPAGVLYRVLSEDAGDAGDAGDANETLLATLREDYTYLFYMVAQSGVSPYESVYRTDDRTLFGPTTLKLRKLMQDFGVYWPMSANDPDDHIANEFAFLSELLGRLAAVYETGTEEASPTSTPEGLPNKDDPELLTHGLRELLAEHLLGFGPVYLERLASRAHTAFYQAVAQLATATLKATGDYLNVQAEYAVQY